MADGSGPHELRHWRGLKKLKAAITAIQAGEVQKGKRLGIKALLEHFGPEMTGRMKNKLRRHERERP